MMNTNIRCIEVLLGEFVATLGWGGSAVFFKQRLMTQKLTIINMYLKIVALCLFILGCSSQFKCHRGQYVYYPYIGLPVCLDCEPGTFEPQDNHENFDCRPCSLVNVHAHQVLIEECTTTSDTVIGCREGFYEARAGVHHGHVDLDCHICTTCDAERPVEVRKCTNTSDAVCCRQPGVALNLDANGATPSCNETYLVNDTNFVCQRGQYLDLSNPSGARCLDCREGTYSDKDNHRDVDCSPCTRPIHFNHELIRVACSPVSDAVIGCEKGYFRVVRHSLSYQDVDCLKCTICDPEHKLTVRPCGETHDAVCWDRWGQ